MLSQADRDALFALFTPTVIARAIGQRCHTQPSKWKSGARPIPPQYASYLANVCERRGHDHLAMALRREAQAGERRPSAVGFSSSREVPPPLRHLRNRSAALHPRH
jgi:hypothetical protein